MTKTRPEITGGKTAGDADLDAYSISQFCARHGLSVATFYKLKDQMPEVFRIGSRVLISKEAAARWRREREVATPA
jgi:hypothetical protein